MSDNEKIEVGDRVQIMALDIREGELEEMGTLLGSYGTVDDTSEVLGVAFVRIDGSKKAPYCFRMHHLELVKKKNPKYFTGKVICVKNNPRTPNFCTFTVGKVYAIKDGVLYDDFKDWPYVHEIKDVNDLNKRSEDSWRGEFRFIEFKGFANK